MNDAFRATFTPVRTGPERSMVVSDMRIMEKLDEHKNSTKSLKKFSPQEKTPATGGAVAGAFQSVRMGEKNNI